ncbi:MAG: glycosyltransferase [Porphyromonas sp.]|nr:glycosyltransferase [Porphyromonas sp.]
MSINMSRPLISVIVPVYNVEAYLPQCLDSLVGQTYPHLDIILVNDGSPDNSLAICENYAARDERIRVVSRPNGGLSAARNTGLELVTGQYVSFVDSDDWLELDTYERCVEALAKYPELDVLSFGYRYERATGTELVERPERLYRGREYLQGYTQNFKRYQAVVWERIYRASLLSSLRFEEGLLHEDEYFTLQLLARHPEATWLELPTSAYHYRLDRVGAITYRRGERNLRDLITGYARTLDMLSACPEEVAALCRRRIMITVYHLYRNELEGYPQLVPLFESELFSRLRAERVHYYRLEDRLLHKLFLPWPAGYLRWRERFYLMKKSKR